MEAELKAEKERLKRELVEENAKKEDALRNKYDAMQDRLKKQEEALGARAGQLATKEKNLAAEEKRVADRTDEVRDLIKDKTYTIEERNKIVEDYSARLEELTVRLRDNEKAIRQNNREFVPLRRIRDTLERDMKLLRKREAVVAKQQVMVYGVNNIAQLDPERVKKLEQDVQQLTGLQQSVANCEEIMHKNRDRFPTLENLDRVLRAQYQQITADIEEYTQAIAFFASGDTTTVTTSTTTTTVSVSKK